MCSWVSSNVCGHNGQRRRRRATRRRQPSSIPSLSPLQAPNLPFKRAATCSALPYRHCNKLRKPYRKFSCLNQMATLCVPDTWPEVQKLWRLSWLTPSGKSAFKFMIFGLWWPRNERTTGAADTAILERNVNWLKKIWSVKGGSEQTVRPHAHTRLVNYELSIDGLSSRNLKLLSEMKIYLRQVVPDLAFLNRIIRLSLLDILWTVSAF